MPTDTLQLIDEWGPEKVVTEARARQLTTHAAAQRLSQERVRAAMMLRGQVPTPGR